jgi:hypothetical protein
MVGEFFDVDGGPAAAPDGVVGVIDDLNRDMAGAEP